MDKYKWRKKAKFVAYVDLVFALIALLLLTFNAIAISASTLTPAETIVSANLVDGTKPPPPGSAPVGHLGKEHAQEMWAMYYAKAGTTVILVMSIATAVGAIITIVQILAAINLIKSTKKAREPREALKLSVFWRNCNFCFVIMYGICFAGVITEWLPVKLYGTIFIGFIVHVIFIYIVIQFIKELRTSVKSEPLVMDEEDGDLADGNVSKPLLKEPSQDNLDTVVETAATTAVEIKPTTVESVVDDSLPGSGKSTPPLSSPPKFL